MSYLRLPYRPSSQPVRYLISGLFALMAVMAVSALSAAEKTGWFSDVPVLADTEVNAQLSFAFDSPSGRVLVLYLETQTDDASLLAAYSKTLTAVGWTEEAGQFIKQGEQLSLEKIKIENEMFWRLTLIPVTANQLEIR